MEKKEETAWLVVRIGIAFCFLYAGIAGFSDPQAWVGWFPRFIRDVISENILMPIWGIYEIITAIWILSGKKIFIPSVVGSFALFGLIIFNLGAMEIIFRDIPILATTIALAIRYSPRKQQI